MVTLRELHFLWINFCEKIGLSGRSIVPMLVGFGCTVPAVMSTRTLPSERDRKMTILLTSVYELYSKASDLCIFYQRIFPGVWSTRDVCFVSDRGIVIGILVALLYRKTLFRGEAVPFVMELPNYRLPGLKNVMQLLWEKAKRFPAESIYRYFCGNHLYLVFTDL